MLQSLCTCGVDVSKACLDVCFLPERRECRYANTPTGIARFLDDLEDHPVKHVVLEPSGGYERDALKMLQAAGQPVTLVNARQIRDYARAKGLMAKTDALDAYVLADYAVRFRPLPTEALSEDCLRLQALVRRRKQVVRYARQEKTALEHLQDDDLAVMAQDHLESLNEQIATLDANIASLIAGNDALRKKRALLESCKGLGPVSAAILLAEMPELGQIEGRKVVALAGLAPRNRDSGAWRGQRRIGGGRAAVREALYMAALSASRFNPDIARFYQAKKAEGKSSKQALIACARKLLLTLNSLLRDGRTWQAEYSC